jgi:hypothetical protein
MPFQTHPPPVSGNACRRGCVVSAIICSRCADFYVVLIRVLSVVAARTVVKSDDNFRMRQIREKVSSRKLDTRRMRISGGHGLNEEILDEISVRVEVSPRKSSVRIDIRWGLFATRRDNCGFQTLR